MPPRRATSVPAVAPGPAQGPGAHAAAARDPEREVEWQLAAPGLAVVRRWLTQHATLDGLAIERLSTQQLHDTYLDTPDWRIFRAGFALRLRDKQGKTEATLKGLHSARKDVADRRELTEPLPDGGIKALALASGPVGSRVRDVAGVVPLRRLFEARTTRQRFGVRKRDSSQEVGEIALDETRFSHSDGHRRATRLQRVELESTGPDHGALEQLANRLCAECGLEPAKENKFATGLRSGALEPPQLQDTDERTLPPLQPMDGSARAGDFAAAALRRLLLEWRAHEPGARLGERPEALHALRVTGRRMDTVLSLFRAYLPAAFGKRRPKLKTLIDALGAARDVDIRIGGVSTFRDSLPEEDRGALDPLLRQLEAQRRAARSAMLRALDAKAARHWFDTLPRQLDALPQLARTKGHQASALPRTDIALTVVPGLIRTRYRKLRKCAQRLDQESSTSEYHEVRIRAKKLRYALEIVALTYAKPADEMLSALHKLQSRLGTQHDGAIVTRYLGQLAADPPPDFTPRTLFLLGRLAEFHARGTRRVSGKIGKSWRRVRGRRWKALRLRMKELRESTLENNSGATVMDGSSSGDG